MTKRVSFEVKIPPLFVPEYLVNVAIVKFCGSEFAGNCILVAVVPSK